MKVFVFLFLIIVPGVTGVENVSVSVMEGDLVTLHTDKLITTNQQDRIRWFLNDTRIAQIVRGQSQICKDDQCKESFGDRLELGNKTGSLTITHTRTTDSGHYKLQIISSSSVSEKIFSVTVHGVSASEREVKRKSVMEGESVTLDPGVMKNPNDEMTWYFNDVLIAEITGDQSQICTDDQCEERFRDRLKLDHQTGSLTITNTRTEDSGVYQLKINIISRISSGRRRRRSISIINMKSFSVSVIGSGLSSAAVAGICVGVLLVFSAVTAAVIYYRSRNNGVL